MMPIGNKCYWNIIWCCWSMVLVSSSQSLRLSVDHLHSCVHEFRVWGLDPFSRRKLTFSVLFTAIIIWCFPCFCFIASFLNLPVSKCFPLSTFSRQLLTLLLPELTLLYHPSYLNPLLITQAILTVECPFLNANCFCSLSPFSQLCALLPLITYVPQKSGKFPCAPSLPPAGGTENMLN